MNPHFFEHHARTRYAELVREACRERAVREARSASRSVDADVHGPAAPSLRAAGCTPAQVPS